MIEKLEIYDTTIPQNSTGDTKINWRKDVSNFDIAKKLNEIIDYLNEPNNSN